MAVSILRYKELRSMGKLRRGFFSLAAVALVGILAGEARSAPISMTIDVTGGSLLVDLVATATPNTYNVDAAGIASVNAFLAAQGSQYQFVSLGGSSNFPGDATQGQLILTGEIHSVGTAGSDSFLRLTETETSFTSPTGASGTLNSSSTGNFTNQPAGGGHEALSMFNSTTAGPYSVLSSATTPNPQGGMTSVGVAPVSTLYTLTNVATFGLGKPASTEADIVDSFGVTATVTAVAIPEPASIVMFLTGMPLPLVVVGLLRRLRRRALVQG